MEDKIFDPRRDCGAYDPQRDGCRDCKSHRACECKYANAECLYCPVKDTCPLMLAYLSSSDAFY